MALRVAFFGTPAFAAASLRTLARSPHEVAGVVSQPDRARGRGLKITVEAVKAAALELGLPVHQPDRLKDSSFLETFRALAPDLAVVAAYGKLLPQALLDIPRLGFINVHASLLPRWRGAAPIHRAILSGDATTGITIMRVVLALDAGPMLSHVVTAIDANETSVDLESRLAALGGPLLVETIDALARGAAAETAQDSGSATYAAKLERRDSDVDWTRPARDIHNQIRGLHPWPLAASTLAGRRLLLLRSIVEPHPAVESHPVVASGFSRTGTATPGTVLSAGAEGIVVAAGTGAVRLVEVQPEGRRPMAARDFLNGTRVAAGDSLG